MMIEYIVSDLAAALETIRHDFHFPGHLLPGTAFILLGFWWTWNVFQRYGKSEQRQNSEKLLNHDGNGDVSNTLTFSATYNGDVVGYFYCEGFYKVSYATFDLFCHILVVVYGGDMTDEWQHMTVYVFFILNGAIDIILHMKLYKMPHGMDYLASAIAWTAFGCLFISHTHGKTDISIFYHKELGWLAIVVGVVTLMQYKYESNTLIALTRGCCCILAGTWLYQIAFSFHNPFVAANQHRNVVYTTVSGTESVTVGVMNDPYMPMIEETQRMNAVTISTWHVILVGCLATFIGIVATRRKQVHYKRLRLSCV